MSDLKNQLIKLGTTNPELRPHIRKVLASKVQASSKALMVLNKAQVSVALRKGYSQFAEVAYEHWWERAPIGTVVVDDDTFHVKVRHSQGYENTYDGQSYDGREEVTFDHVALSDKDFLSILKMG